MATPKLSKQWSPEAMDPPKLSDMDWNMTMLLGLVFIVMAALQVASFTDFKDVLSAIGLSGSASWAAILILAELWAAVGFFKLRLSALFRMVSSLFALLVGGFWFFETIRQAAMSPDVASPITNMGYFGRFLSQPPGWWTVLEASVVLLWAINAVELTKVKSAK